jgi:hypothetical protein
MKMKLNKPILFVVVLAILFVLVFFFGNFRMYENFTEGATTQGAVKNTQRAAGTTPRAAAGTTQRAVAGTTQRAVKTTQRAAGTTPRAVAGTTPRVIKPTQGPAGTTPRAAAGTTQRAVGTTPRVIKPTQGPAGTTPRAAAAGTTPRVIKPTQGAIKTTQGPAGTTPRTIKTTQGADIKTTSERRDKKHDAVHPGTNVSKKTLDELYGDSLEFDTISHRIIQDIVVPLLNNEDTKGIKRDARDILVDVERIHDELKEVYDDM